MWSDDEAPARTHARRTSLFLFSLHLQALINKKRNSQAPPPDPAAGRRKRLRKVGEATPPPPEAGAPAGVAGEPAPMDAEAAAPAPAAAPAATAAPKAEPAPSPPAKAEPAPAPPPKAAAPQAEPASSSDVDIVSDDDESEDEEEEEEDPGEKKKGAGSGAGGPAPAAARPPTKNKNTAAAAAAILRAAAKEETLGGVGMGSLAAAAEYVAGATGAPGGPPWAAGAPVPFSFLTDTFEEVANTTKRLEITTMLTAAFRAIMGSTPADLLPAVYLCVNRVAPAHAGVELGIGDATLVRALGEATGRSEAQIRAGLAESGDLGTVAFTARATQRTMFTPPPLTLRSVFAAFKAIAAAGGTGSQDRKRGSIVKLLAAARGHEAGYLIRALQGKLRIGLAEQTVLTSLAHAAELEHGGVVEGGEKAGAGGGGPPSTVGAAAAAAALANRLEAAAQAVKRAYCECPSYDALVPALLAAPPAALPGRVSFTVGVPVRPMLAKPTTGVSEVLDRATAAAAGGDGSGAAAGLLAEYKYDGERAQVHVADPAALPPGGRRVTIYSRNSEDNTLKYPDVAAAVLAGLAPGVVSLVLDAEVVAIDRASGKLLPFQVLAGRKKVADAANPGAPVALFAFDALHLNGETLLEKPLIERREALKSALVLTPGVLDLAVGSTTQDPDELASFLDAAVAGGTEGLIVKGGASTYEPSRRSTHWLKLKKDYLDGVGDTFDVVPIGAWHGRGKRQGVYGAYLLAVYDEEGEEFQTISKIGTGFSEEALEALSSALSSHVISGPRPYYRWGEACAPDVWFEPAAVWEVKAADLSISPVHRAAAGKADPARGVSIRFPRLLRVREDKAPEQATTAEQVAEMYARQVTVAAQAGAGGNGGGGGEDDIY